MVSKSQEGIELTEWNSPSPLVLKENEETPIEPSNKTSGIAERIFKSPLFWAAAATIAAIGCCAVCLSAGILPASVAIISMVAAPILFTCGVAKNNKMFYEFFLSMQIIGNSLGCYTWYHEIPMKDGRPSIFLGGLPLAKHKEELKQLKIEAVLSINESFELQPSIAGTPVSREDWERECINFHNIENEDVKPVPPNRIEEGVEYIEEQRKKERRVYIHCKSGVGRSATVLTAYLMKYYEKNLDQAIDMVVRHRPSAKIELYSKAKRKTLKEYEEIYLKGKTIEMEKIAYLGNI